MRLLAIGLPVLALLLSLPALAAPPPATVIPLRDFARLPAYQKVSISPSGEYLGALAPFEDQTVLVTLRLADLKPTGVLRLTRGQHVINFWWVSDQRVVATIATKDGYLASPLYTGELIGMNADGSKQTYLYGYRGRSSPTNLGDTADLGFAEMIDPLPADPDHALIQVERGYSVGESYTSAYRIDVYSGRRTRVETAPAKGFGYLVPDHQGRIRYSMVVDENYQLRNFWKNPDSDEWLPENVGALEGAEISPLGFNAAGDAVYLDSTETGDRHCLVERRLGDPGERRSLACDPVADLQRVVMNADGTVPVAAIFAAGKPRAVLLDSEDPLRQRYAQLLESFEARGEFVLPVSATRDGKQVILNAYSDRNPGDYYLFDMPTGKARYLLSEHEWIDPARMAERRPITYRARDGQTIHAYLTLPPGREAKKLPLVMLPHGGPKGPRDHWAWESDAQALASRGYAVLQPNFRGSGGYGVKFETDARYAWGTTLIDDITDGTRWAVEQGIADPARLCIYGGSYGGYAALMSAVREPDLYRCAVGYVGVYDQELWTRDSDVAEDRDRGRNYIRTWVARDADMAKQQSPIQQLDKLKAALFLIHGGADERVPISQFKALSSALKKRDYPFEELIKPKEGHGFYDVDNRTELLEKLVAFLDRHIGAPAAPDRVPEPAPSAATDG